MNGKFVLIRNPKCAGTSITKALSSCISTCFFNGVDEIDDSPLIIVQAGNTSKAFFNRYYSLRSEYEFVSLTRNPYDRLVSGWFFSKEQGWVDEDLSTGALKRCQHKSARYHTLFRQINVLKHKDEIAVDRVIRFEHLQEDFARLLVDYEIDPAVHLNHHNKSLHKPWQEYYATDPELKAFVECHFCDDFEVLKKLGA